MQDSVSRCAFGRAGEGNAMVAVGRPDVLYIGGYGRSGSTIIEAALATHPCIVAGGELSRVAPLLLSEGACCSCGKSVFACKAWMDIAESLKKMVKEGSASLDTISNPERYFVGPAAESLDLSFWIRLNDRMISKLVEQKAGAKFIVDASKTSRSSFFRPYLLQKKLGYNVYFLHVRRRLSQVLKSVAKGTNAQLEAGRSSFSFVVFVRAIFGWAIANVRALHYRTLFGQRYRSIQYEHFISDPDFFLGEIFQWCGLRPNPDWESDMISQERHILTGNRARLKREPIAKKSELIGRDYAGEFLMFVGCIFTRNKFME